MHELDGIVEAQVLPPRAARRFQGLERIGYGGMGEVFRARDSQLERAVAIKVIRQDLAKSASLRERFRREVVVLARIQHPNVVRFFDFWEEEGCTFYTMEFVEGRKLDGVIEDEELTVDGAVELLARLCDGIAAVHAAGVIHRDIKPDNVIVTADKVPILIDFGIAKFLDPLGAGGLTATGEMVGTFRYLAPEILSGAGADERSDVYQLAIILYQALTGRHPFGESSVLDIVQGTAFEAIEPVSTIVEGVDDELDDIVWAGLAIDPAQRLPTPVAMGAALKAWSIGADTGLTAYRTSSSAAPIARAQAGDGPAVSAAGDASLGTADRVQPRRRYLPVFLCGVIILFFLGRLMISVRRTAARDQAILNNLLFTAVHQGNDEEVQSLARMGADLSARDERGNTPLHHAARRGHVAVVGELCRFGADRTVSNEDGRRPIDLLAAEAPAELVRLLHINGQAPATLTPSTTKAVGPQ